MTSDFAPFICTNHILLTIFAEKETSFEYFLCT